MATSPIPAPDNPSAGGPGPGGGFASPAPPQEDQGAGQLLKLSLGIVSNARMIAKMVPGATPEVRQINDLVTKIQGKIKQNQPTPEPQAPPV